MLENELQSTFFNRTKLPRDSEHLFTEVGELQVLLMMYTGAIREVKTKLEVLNDELAVSRKRNPIEFIKTRIKTPISIAAKLEKKGAKISVESIEENLNDVAGVRVICAFVDDIYQVADMLTSQDDIKLITKKDYIKKPKSNGYRSLHLIVEVPVFFSEQKKSMRVEVQIRTIAMDFWASLEHQLKYKKNVKDAEMISEELKECADVINKTDYHMLGIRNRIQEED